KQRGGLIVIAGLQHMPASYSDKESPLAEMLPVEFVPHTFTSDLDRPPQFKVQVSKTGRDELMMQLGDTAEQNAKIWKELEGLYWFYPVTKLRKEARVMLEHPKIKMGEKPMPLMALQKFGKGEVMWLGIEETWRWRFNEEDKYFGRFWSQIISYMGLPHLQGRESQQVQMGLEGGRAVYGRP